jgi:glycosyltransferase involved in cell wall biosynthesis
MKRYLMESTGLEQHQTTAPTFSILVPSFNPGQFFEEAIESALSQLRDGDELLIQDACSDDGTVDKINEFERRDARVRAVVERDSGQSDALNRALARSTSEWILWLNADDVLLPGALQALRAAIVKTPGVQIVSGDHEILRVGGDSVDVYRGHKLCRPYLLKVGCASFSGSIAVRTDLLRELGGFRVDLHCTMDYELQFRLADSGRPQVHVNTPIGALRFHEASKSGNLWKTFVKETALLRMQYARTPAEKALGLRGTALHVVSIPIFKLRLTKGYRRARRWIRPNL